MDSELSLPSIVSSQSRREQEQLCFRSSLLSGAQQLDHQGRAQQLPVRKSIHSSPQHLI